VNELNTSQSDAGGGFGLEAEHASYPSFDPAMSCSMALFMYLLERMVMGFPPCRNRFSFHSAAATIAGIEVADMIRKNQCANDNRSPFEVLAELAA